ncbi:MAG: DnaD domain protein [Clostridia bacterium]|nr:DnaD domain protein [Clostridia bacterium]
MAIFRNVHISFWEDSKVQEEMDKDERYFFLYLLTNPHTSQIGCYEITIRQMEYETGLDKSEIERYIERFENELGIIEYSKTTKELLIKNWYKYNFNKSPKMFSHIKKEIQNIKNIPFKNYIDTISIPYIYGNAIRIIKEQEKEEEQEESKNQNGDSCVDGFLEDSNCADKVFMFYEQNIGTVSPYTYELLNSYRVDGFNDEILIYALQLAVNANAKNNNYIKAILNNWKKSNVKTLIDAQNENKKKNIDVLRKKEKPNNAYEAKEIGNEDLSKFYLN